ncbi:Druantia anti-phage system protein DruA [Leptospirillum ferriphilum]|uniref:Uncharacterized protein n=1 Tax=Leptospirillum ferriphilum TaxID=178606 RepID=A0A1V3SSF2_9BACT|nr:Druantia anti-phage system protein DruA [Leptospirillum ferriphilum]EAY56676.1 MAG: hypothetical protein UBAL2_80620322 [Leptospirillum rubarum]OOH70085.1 hypothetical protein BOX24_11335 [Leptospirillum ferriphilum]
MEATEKIVREDQAVLGTLKDLGKVTVMPLDPGSREEDLWDSLIREHHSLGDKNLPGRRIKYIARAGEQPVVALSFSGSAPKIEVRDRKFCFLDDPAHPIPTASSNSPVRVNTLKLLPTP